MFFAVWKSLALRHVPFAGLYAAGVLAAFWASGLGLLASLLVCLPAAALTVLAVILVIALPLSTTMPAFDWTGSTGGSYLSGEQTSCAPFTITLIHSLILATLLG